MRKPTAFKSIGITFVAFGAEADLLAAHSLAFSRQHTKLPFQVVTNIPESWRHAKWKEVTNVKFTYLEKPINFNRTVKCQLYKYTIFEKCIYCDVDAVIQNSGLDALLDNIIAELTFSQLDTYSADRILGIYRRAQKQFNCTLPLDIYYGAFFAFKPAKTKDFFDLWFKYYTEFGQKRDMPPLACTLQKWGSIARFEKSVFAGDEINPKALVQHVTEHVEFPKRIGLIRMPLLQCYESGSLPDDWKWVTG